MRQTWQQNESKTDKFNLFFLPLFSLHSPQSLSYRVGSSDKGEQGATHGQQDQAAVQVQYRRWRPADAQPQLGKKHINVHPKLGRLQNCWLSGCKRSGGLRYTLFSEQFSEQTESWRHDFPATQGKLKPYLSFSVWRAKNIFFVSLCWGLAVK